MGLLLIIGTVAVAGLVFYWKKMYDLAKERMRMIEHIDKIPGPYSVPILGTVWQFKWNLGALARQLTGWCREYSGKGHGLIRLWLATKPMVQCIKPETVKIVLERTDIITKGDEYDILLPWLGTGLLISTGEKWRSRRKLLSPTFHFKVLNEFIPVFDSQSKQVIVFWILVTQLEAHAERGKEFDIFPFIKRCALDAICETIMGCHVSSQENHDHPYVLSVHRLIELGFMHERMPWLWIPVIWYASSYGFEYDRHLRVVTDFTRKVIKERVAARGEGVPAEKEKKRAFLDLLLDLKAEGNLSYEDIREEVDTFMFEGHDTTATSIGWTLWFMAFNSECQTKVQQEMDEIFGSSDRRCTSEDIKSMKYLEKCIKESLRLRPSVPHLTRKVEHDIEIGDVTVPKGCSVLINPFIIHTDATIYDDPMRYDPERFSEDNIQNRHPYAFIPFSAGPRNCIGQKFALLEEKTMLSWFFRRYSISSLRKFEKNIPLPQAILTPLLGFPVVISRRCHEFVADNSAVK
ncbi:hypothetical protein Q1695_010764 [Nippostrongylus brasiliensis]|nr:hypothetical protein Q1695_010764 [Nippostrongylus brasiliensis]